MFASIKHFRGQYFLKTILNSNDMSKQLKIDANSLLSKIRINKQVGQNNVFVKNIKPNFKKRQKLPKLIYLFHDHMIKKISKFGGNS